MQVKFSPATGTDQERSSANGKATFHNGEKNIFIQFLGVTHFPFIFHNPLSQKNLKA